MNTFYAWIGICVFGITCRLSCEMILTAVEGEDVELECKILDWAATPPCSGRGVAFEWHVNRSAIVECNKTYADYTVVLNKTSGALVIPHVSGSLNGTRFHCQVLQGAGTNNDEIELIVFNGTDITETTSVLSGVLGGGIALECFVKNVPSGFPNITFKWLLGNKPLLDVCTNKDSNNAGRYNYHHDNHGCNLTINSLELTDEGSYICEAQYSATTVWKNTSLTVNVPPRDVYIINATTGEICNGDVNVRPGTYHSFTCRATDTKPPAEITWTFNGKNTSGETRVAGTRLHNTSSTFTVPSFQPGQRGGNLTCTATGAGGKVVTNIRLLSQQQETDPSMQSQLSLILVAVGIAAALLVVLVAAIVFWKRRKNHVPSDGNQPVVHYTRTGTDRPTASVSPVLNTVAGPSDAGNIYEENTFLPSSQSPPAATPPSSSGIQATRNFRRYNFGNMSVETVVLPGPLAQSDMPTNSNQQPAATISKEVLIYADVHHTKTHPLDAPPIRTEPPTQYADIDNFLILTPVETPPLLREDAPSLGVEGQSVDGLEEEGKEERAPPRPLRGNPIPYLVRDWQM